MLKLMVIIASLAGFLGIAVGSVCNSLGDSIYYSPSLLAIQSAASLLAVLMVYVMVNIIVMPIVRRVHS